MAHSVPIHISCPPEFVKELDEHIGADSRKRSAFFVKAASEKMERDKQKDVLKKARDKWIRDTLIPLVREHSIGKDFHDMVSLLEHPDQREKFRKKLNREISDECLILAIHGVMADYG